jgi:hypothetical protein
MSKLLDPSRFFFETNPPTPDAAAQSPLFKLSRELRDHIYHYAWNGETITQRLGDDFLVAEYRHEAEDEEMKAKMNRMMKKKKRKRVKKSMIKQAEKNSALEVGLPNWLRTSRQVLAEGMTQFYCRARCTHYETKDNTSDYFLVACSEYRLLALSRIRYLSINELNAPISLEAALIGVDDYGFATGRHIDGDVGTNTLEYPWIDFEKYGPEDRIVVIPVYSGWKNDIDRSTTEDILEAHRLQKHSLKELTLRFAPTMQLELNELKLSIDDEDAEYMPWNVDLSYFEGFGTDLDRVEFILDTPDSIYTCFINPEAQMFDIYDRIQLSLETLAKKLVGGSNGSSWIIKDWIEVCYTWRAMIVTARARAWHLEIARIPGPTSRGVVVHQGLRNFPYIPDNEDDLDCVEAFCGNAKEGSPASIEARKRAAVESLARWRR